MQMSNMGGIKQDSEGDVPCCKCKHGVTHHTGEGNSCTVKNCKCGSYWWEAWFGGPVVE